MKSSYLIVPKLPDFPELGRIGCRGVRIGEGDGWVLIQFGHFPGLAV